MSDGPLSHSTHLPVEAEYELLLARSIAVTEWPDFDESTRATTFYTTGTTSLPKAVFFSHRQLVLHTLTSRSVLAGPGEGRFNHDDVYMPLTPMFHVHAWGLPYVATLMGVKQVYPGRYLPDRLLNLFEREKVTFSHCVPTILQMILDTAIARAVRLDGWLLSGAKPSLLKPLLHRRPRRARTGQIARKAIPISGLIARATCARGSHGGKGSRLRRGPFPSDATNCVVGEAAPQAFNSAKRAATSRLPICRSEAIAFSVSPLGLALPASQA